MDQTDRGQAFPLLRLLQLHVTMVVLLAMSGGVLTRQGYYELLKF